MQKSIHNERDDDATDFDFDFSFPFVVLVLFPVLISVFIDQQPAHSTQSSHLDNLASCLPEAMALNPPILSIPTQEADRNEHIQRFLISLPRHGPGSDGDLRGTDDLMEHDQAVQDGDNDRERKEESEVALGPQAGRAEQGPDLEAERREP